MTTTIRPAEPGDLEAVRDVELAAAQLFVGTAHEWVAQEPLRDLAGLEAAQAEGRVLVSTDEQGVTGWVLIEDLGWALHIEQVDVAPRAQRQGLGRALIDAVGQRAALFGMRAVSLTTFTDIAWNAPYYERLGFERVDPATAHPALLAKSEAESARGLDPKVRVIMQRPVEVAGGPPAAEEPQGPTQRFRLGRPRGGRGPGGRGRSGS